MKSVYSYVLDFKRKYPNTVAWRLKANSKVVQQHVNPDEKVLYAFAGQKNNNPFNIISTFVFCITDKRLLLGQKRLLFGYWYTSITPDLFNDLKVVSNVLWGKIHIDTVKEFVTISNLDKRSLDEIETVITTNMIKEKKKYKINRGE